MDNNEKFMKDYEGFKTGILSVLNRFKKQIQDLNAIAVDNKYEINRLRQMQEENSNSFKRLYVNERIGTLESKINAFQNQINALQDQISTSLRGRW